MVANLNCYGCHLPDQLNAWPVCCFRHFCNFVRFCGNRDITQSHVVLNDGVKKILFCMLYYVMMYVHVMHGITDEKWARYKAK